MKPEAQRIAIAQACGWTYMRTSYLADINKRPPTGVPPNLSQQYAEDVDKFGNESHWTWHESIPDYGTDLNAMHEAEKTLTGRQWDDYCYRVSQISRNDRGLVPFKEINPSYVIDAFQIHATAAQRAEAFLRTLNLWTDDAR